MPLIKGSGRGAFEANVKTEIAAGKPTKQALAIAYRTAALGGGKKPKRRPR